MLNSEKLTTRFVIARSKHQALSILGKIRTGLVKPKGILFQTRDQALVRRNTLRQVYRTGYQIFEVPYNNSKDK